MTACPHPRLDEPLLSARIRTIARGDEDLEQHLYLALLEKVQTDSHFAGQEVGFWVRWLRWQASHFAEKARVYGRYVQPEPVSQECTQDALQMGPRIHP